jgi:hypothetical protein
MFFAAGMYFPDAWRAMGMGRAGPLLRIDFIKNQLVRANG